jgi:hypothetical protein
VIGGAHPFAREFGLSAGGPFIRKQATADCLGESCDGKAHRRARYPSDPAYNSVMLFSYRQEINLKIIFSPLFHSPFIQVDCERVVH